MVGLIILSIQPVYAEDELYLSGIVKDVDRNTKTVFVDVKSSSCHGMRKFVVDEPAAYEDLVNERISFVIDSSVCRGDEVYKVLSIGR